MLRATARVHISCDGRALGRILATAMPEESPPEDDRGVPGRPPGAGAKRLAGGDEWSDGSESICRLCRR